MMKNMKNENFDKYLRIVWPNYYFRDAGYRKYTSTSNSKTYKVVNA